MWDFLSNGGTRYGDGIMNTELINRIHKRVNMCFGANPLPFDRLFKGTREEAEYWRSVLIRERDYEEMLATLDTAALLIAERDAELKDLRAAAKASGLLSMGMGAKRDPAKDQQ